MKNSLLWRALVILTGTVALSGCYESNVKVLNYGDQANVEGTYRCTSESSLFPNDTMTITEMVAGSGKKVDYRYQIQGGGQFRFTEMDTGMMLGQTQRGKQGWGRRERDAAYGFVFVDIRGASGFTVHQAQFSASKKDLDEAAQARNVRTQLNKYGRGPTVTLSGSADEIFEFFNDHARYMLQQIASCSSTE